jgi:hypothetical protein
VRSRDDVGEIRAYDISFLSLRFLGDSWGVSSGALPVFRAGKMERQSVVDRAHRSRFAV